jgi:hypothetical protein
MRERKGRALPFVAMNEAEGVALAKENVCRMATISADEASIGTCCTLAGTVDRVNHSSPTATTAICTNMAESYFSRLRRMVAASTTTSARSTCTSTRTTPHGWKTTAAATTARWRWGWLRTAWARRSAGRGKATGSGRLDRDKQKN